MGRCRATSSRTSWVATKIKLKPWEVMCSSMNENAMNNHEPSAFIGFQMLDKTLQLRSPHRAMLGERTNRAARFSSPAFPATPQRAQSCLQHSCTDGHMDIPHAIYLASLLSKCQQNSSKFNKQTKMLSSISDATAGTNESSQRVSINPLQHLEKLQLECLDHELN